MRYMGGKARTASHIVAFLESVRKPSQVYVEPFVGAGWILTKLEGERIASDSCLDLILLWESLQKGWIPPDTISEAEYQQLKASTIPSALRAFAGFGCSFAGKWFGGYARSGSRNYASNARNSLLKKVQQLNDVRFICTDYASLKPTDALIYCDPPYSGTTGYGATEKFDWVRFWGTVRQWSAANTVIISEYAAPDDFACVLEIPTKTDMRIASGDKERRIDRLFQYKSPSL